LIRLKIPSISVQKHEETTKELNELIEKKIELYTKKEDVEINFIFKTIEALNIVINHGDKTYKSNKDYEGMDFYVLSTVIKLVTNFLSRRGQTVPI
ncbi:MAG: hypothetical protein ACRC31_04570, partial [Cetobacterium sp.]